MSNMVTTTFDIQHIQIASDTLQPENLDEVIFINPWEMARFPGCEELDISLSEKKKCAEEKMWKFVYGNFKYPPDVCAEGTIVIGFTIDKNGNINDPKVMRDISGLFGEEGLRVVSLMPCWIPGKFNGKPTDVRMNLPIRIGLRKSLF